MAGLSACLFLSGWFLVPFAAGGAQTTWNSINYGSYFLTPQVIDATNFINSATWHITNSPYPYATAHTLTYLNKGVMYSKGGWEFDLGPASSGGSALRNMSGSFTNTSTGTIQSDDINNGVGYSSHLWVSATNVVNQSGGTLEAGSSGQILLNGANVNLSRSMVEIVPATSSSSGSAPLFSFGSPTNITPAEGFNYVFWAQTNTSFDSSQLWDGFHFFIPTFQAQGVCQSIWTIGGEYSASSNFTFYSSRSNGYPTVTFLGPLGIQGPGTYPTNYAREVVFVIPPSQANFTADARFTPSANLTNVFDTVAVRLMQMVTNPVTLSLQANTFYLVDVLASTTNSGLFQAPPNATVVCSDPTYQPQNYLVSRTDLQLQYLLS